MSSQPHYDFIAFLNSLMWDGYADELLNHYPNEFNNQLQQFMENQNLKICKYCQEVIAHGRIDKKFCDDSCRNAYNNGLMSDQNNLRRNINNALSRNRNVLREFATKKFAEVAELAERGFRFNYFTHEEETDNGVTYFVYEYGYRKIETGKIEILTK